VWKGKELYAVYVNYICHYILHTRNIFSCPECLNSQKVDFRFLRQGLYPELPLYVDRFPVPAYICPQFHQLADICVVVFLTTPTALHPLSLRQSVCFDTPHKQTLQADYWWMLDIKFLDV
jgi:hypothetical protein